jgi:glucose dehydrogenase
MSDQDQNCTQQPCIYDVVVVGAGVAGAIIAKQLGAQGKRVLILESGHEIEPNNNEYMKRYYESAFKVPETPYTPATTTSQRPSPSNLVAKYALGERSDANLVNPTNMNAPRPTALSVSLRAWPVPEKGQWAADAEKCDPKSEKNYFVQSGPLPFGSTFERIAGGTARHWLGISLRHLPNDFRMGEQYHTFTYRPGTQVPWPNWPKNCQYEELKRWYPAAEGEIGVAGDSKTQNDFEQPFGTDGPSIHGYPMVAIPLSHGDKVLNEALSHATTSFSYAVNQQSVQLKVTPIPCARNSEPFDRRRACAGNSSCIPICPIQAKYDPTITLRDALNTGNVCIEYKSVAINIAVSDPSLGPNNKITGIDYIRYQDESGGPKTAHRAVGRLYILAANAIETPRLLLLSNHKKGITARKDCPIGRYLMDHPFFIAPASAKTENPVYGYRGPLVTGGIEVLRDGPFRENHASFRCDVSNSGWNLTSNGTARSIAEDLIRGRNDSDRNQDKKTMAGIDLLTRLNQELSCQASLGFLIEQTPDRDNLVKLSDHVVDGLGLPRPEICYDFSEYTKQGILAAHKLAQRIYKQIGWEPYSDKQDPESGKSDDNCSFDVIDHETQRTLRLRYMGAGHIAGTCRMGENPADSVVNDQLRFWDYENLYIAGSSVFPTLGTANPTLTIAALSLRLSAEILKVLNGANA